MRKPSTFEVVKLHSVGGKEDGVSPMSTVSKGKSLSVATLAGAGRD